jgi:hypothetical protein
MTEQFTPVVWQGYVINSQKCADTLAVFCNEDGTLRDEESKDALIGLLLKAEGFIPLTLGDTGSEARDVVLDIYQSAWKGSDGDKMFCDAIYKEVEFMAARRTHFGLQSATCRTEDRVLITTGHSAKPSAQSKWLDGTVITRKSDKQYEVRIVELDADAIESWTLIQSIRADARAKFVAFLGEREESAVVIELMPRIELAAESFTLAEPVTVAAPTPQTRQSSKRGGSYVAKLELLNGDAHIVSGTSEAVGLESVALALAANPNESISATDRGTGNTKSGNWVPRAAAAAADGKAFSKKWLRSIEVAAA